MAYLWFNVSVQVGTEVSFKLPLASSSSFESMFREIESSMRGSVSNSISDEGKDYIGIESYGISVTTLEEVFLRVAGCDYDDSECFEQKESIHLPGPVVSQASEDPSPKKLLNSDKHFGYKRIFGVISAIVGGACGLIFATILSFIKFLSEQCCNCCMISRSTFWQHCKALFIKRAISARRDRKTIIFQLLIPAVFLLIGLIFLQLKPHPDQLSVTFTTSNFNPLLSGGGGGGPIPFDLSWSISKEVCQLLLISLGIISFWFVFLWVVTYGFILPSDSLNTPLLWNYSAFWFYIACCFVNLPMLQVAEYVKGGWIQQFKSSAYKFPDSERALADAIEAAGPVLGPVLISMSEYLMSSFNESYQSRYVDRNF